MQINDHGLTTRDTLPNACPSSYRMKKGGNSGTTTLERPPSTQNKKETTPDPNNKPCSNPLYPLYVSCGGPEILSGHPNYFIGVLNCKKCNYLKLIINKSTFFWLTIIDYHTSIEARGMFPETDRLNHYCCYRFRGEASSGSIDTLEVQVMIRWLHSFLIIVAWIRCGGVQVRRKNSWSSASDWGGI